SHVSQENQGLSNTAPTDFSSSHFSEETQGMSNTAPKVFNSSHVSQENQGLSNTAPTDLQQQSRQPRKSSVQYCSNRLQTATTSAA
ncbi:unnamed protein product, partial [Allacma fusca]